MSKTRKKSNRRGNKKKPKDIAKTANLDKVTGRTLFFCNGNEERIRAKLSYPVTLSF